MQVGCFFILGELSIPVQCLFLIEILVFLYGDVGTCAC